MSYVSFHSQKEVATWFVSSAVGEILDKQVQQLPGTVQGALVVKANKIFAVTDSQDKLCSLPLQGGTAPCPHACLVYAVGSLLPNSFPLNLPQPESWCFSVVKAISRTAGHEVPYKECSLSLALGCCSVPAQLQFQLHEEDSLQVCMIDVSGLLLYCRGWGGVLQGAGGHFRVKGSGISEV